LIAVKMKVICALFIIALVGARPSPWSPATKEQREQRARGSARAAIDQRVERRPWYPGWNGYGDVPSYEYVATPWAAEMPPASWAQVPNTLSGMPLPQVPVQISPMAGIQGGVQYSYWQQQGQQQAPIVNFPEASLLQQPIGVFPEYAGVNQLARAPEYVSFHQPVDPYAALRYPVQQTQFGSVHDTAFVR